MMACGSGGVLMYLSVPNEVKNRGYLGEQVAGAPGGADVAQTEHGFFDMELEPPRLTSS